MKANNQPGRARQAPMPERERPAELRFANYQEVGQLKNDRPVRVRRSLGIAAIDAQLGRLAPGWPKRVGDKLFVISPRGEQLFLSSAVKLFAWVDGLAHVRWARGAVYVSQERFYEHQRMIAERYESMEILPHWPLMAGVFYHCEPVSPSDGCDRLDGLLNLFHPASSVDRELIRGMILTFFWGGPPGARPIFIVTGPNDDPEKGRGIGKSTLLAILADELAGGMIEVSPTDTIASVKTRLLSPKGRQARIVRIDNVKALKFSWADLEGQVTSPTVSGHEMYSGEGDRSNTLIWAITLNGPNLSKDMSQRSILIKLSRPEFRADWDSEVRRYIRENRPEILSEIRGALERAPGEIEPTRWAEWERDVLSKCDRVADCQERIESRQETADVERDEARGFAARIKTKLRQHAHPDTKITLDPDNCSVFIPSRVMAEWYSEECNERVPTNTASGRINLLPIKELSKADKKFARGFLWRAGPTGEHPDVEPCKPDFPISDGSGRAR